MDNIVVLILYLAVGLLCRQVGLPKEAGQTLSKYVIFVALPCLTLLTIQPLDMNADLILPTLAIWLTIFAGIVWFGSLGLILGLPRPVIGAMIMGAAFSNTSFVGIPIVSALAGEQYAGLAIWLDQAGTYLALSSVGLVVAVMTSPATDERLSLRTVVTRIGTFPPFWALMLALGLGPGAAALGLVPVVYPDIVFKFLSLGADSLVPVALVAVGLQLKISELRGRWLPLGAALSFGLLIAPALALLVFVVGAGIVTDEMKVTVLEAAMGPQIGASVVALQYKLEPGLVAGIVGIGIPLSLITTSAWWWLMTWPAGV